jgi:hypothetical protein
MDVCFMVMVLWKGEAVKERNDVPQTPVLEDHICSCVAAARTEPHLRV